MVCGFDNVFHQPTAEPELYRHDLKAGDPFSTGIVPQVVPGIIEEHAGEQMFGPILPVCDLIASTFQRIGQIGRVEAGLGVEAAVK